MEKTKVLYVSQEIFPYNSENQMSNIGSNLPQKTQEDGKDIRIFLPKYGTINERRHQLHEVIRLSGMNLIIDDFDHQLIIKVASIQQLRMQVYFIDNEEYFPRRQQFHDIDGNFMSNNDERLIFYCKGVIETVRKLGWSPDVIHCQGWFSSLVPFYIKKLYSGDPLFENTKVVYSVFDNSNSAAKNIVALNAGAAIYASGISSSIKDGVIREGSSSGLGTGRPVGNVKDGVVRAGSSSGLGTGSTKGKVSQYSIKGMERESDAEIVAAYHFLVKKFL